MVYSMKCWTYLKSSILGLIYKTNVNCEMNRNRGCYTIKCSHSLFISSLRIFHKANRLWRPGGPYPTPTEIEITVQEQKCTVFDSAVCQASKQIEQSRTWTWGSPYSEDTVSVIFSYEFNNRCKKLKFWTNSIRYGNKVAEE